VKVEPPPPTPAVAQAEPEEDVEEPEEDVEEPEPVASEPRRTAAGALNPLDDVVTVQRVRPVMKTPLLLLGGASLLGAGGTYAASYLMHQRFEAATTTDEANQLKTSTNALVIASGGIAVLGVGLGYWGVLLDGGVGLGLHRRF
jgi:outer membrane biosynthesis protein TonB